MTYIFTIFALSSLLMVIPYIEAGTDLSPATRAAADCLIIQRCKDAKLHPLRVAAMVALIIFSVVPIAHWQRIVHR